MADDDKKPTDAPKPDPAQPPKTPGEVKRTPIKHPQIIAMEKRISEQQDEIDGLKGWQDEVNGVLEGLEVGAPKGPKKIPVTDPTKPTDPPPKKGILNEIGEDIQKFLHG